MALADAARWREGESAWRSNLSIAFLVIALYYLLWAQDWLLVVLFALLFVLVAPLRFDASASSDVDSSVGF